MYDDLIDTPPFQPQMSPPASNDDHSLFQNQSFRSLDNIELAGFIQSFGERTCKSFRHMLNDHNRHRKIRVEVGHNLS